MGMLPPVCAQAYISHNKKTLEASRELVSLNSTAAELCVGARDDELVDVKVTCDGTWSKWGFTALSKFCSVCSARRHKSSWIGGRCISQSVGAIT